jgi:pyrimidine operon attenuation protein / uracil phosphoribosyltransferase
MTQKLILDHIQIVQKVRRIAYEIYEQNFEETALVLAGIQGEGYIMAQLLYKELEQITPFTLFLVEVKFDKTSPYDNTVDFDCDEQLFAGKTIIVVDDVLNTGRTLAYSLAPFVTIPVNKIQVAVLVDRAFRRFPIKADFVGYSLATTINDHVSVSLNNGTEMQAIVS